MSRRTQLLGAHERMFPVHPEERIRAADRTALPEGRARIASALADRRADWGMADQRLAARNAQVQRIAVRVQLVIMAVTAAALAIAAPSFVYDVALGLMHGPQAASAVGPQGTPQ